MTQAGVWLVAENAEALDEVAFSRCCEELRPRALRFAAGMLAGDRDRAEELVQEALLRLHGARGRYRQEAGDVRRYAFRVLANLCLDEIRRRKIGNQAMAGAGELARGRGGHGPGGPAAQAESSERRAAVAGAVARLPERERAALLLRELGRHSYAEIAEERETTVSDVNNLIHRARGRFVRLMRPWME